MKPQDLRIGDYVLYGKDICIVDTIETDECIVYNTVDDNQHQVYHSAISPLPITKELLEIVGFYELGSNDYWELSVHGTVYHFMFNNAKGYLMYGSHSVKIKAFHHLQNLVYFLTGKELSITEKIK